jgi:hypothetical protein
MQICSVASLSSVSAVRRAVFFGAIALSTAAASLAPAGAAGLYGAIGPPIGAPGIVLVQKKANPFDGAWTIHATSKTCASKSAVNVLTIVDGAIVKGDPYPAKGSVSASGAIRWTIAGLADGTPVDSKGTLRGNKGSGTYQRRDGRCGGSFTATRG